jgi:MOSC domain-containing protein YiiM
MEGKVVAVARDSGHNFSKQIVDQIEIVAGLGIEGDAHKGVKVKHRSRVKADPTQPNLRQVHLIHSELFAEVGEKGFVVRPADLGENISTVGIDLLGLPRGTKLRIGESVCLEVTGLRNPCSQIDAFQKGLLGGVLEKRQDGKLIRKSGIMSIVIEGGLVQAGDAIKVQLPDLPHHPLERV